MKGYHSEKTIKFGAPGIYKIEVSGTLDRKWADRLAGMQITSRVDKDGHMITILTGNLRDQAQLSGVLNSLYDMHMPILLVKMIAEDNHVAP